MGRRRGRGSGRERGADLRYNMEITLEEAYRGKAAQDAPPDVRDVRDLLGHGRQGRHQAEGLRELRRRRAMRHAQGFFTIERTCPACQGRGQMIEIPASPARAPAA